MAREMFFDIITQRDNADGKLIALDGIRVIVKKRNPDLTYSPTNIYTTREGSTVKGSSGQFVTTDGRVEFYADPGIYEITFEDTTDENRVSSSRRIEWSPVSYDDTRLKWQTGMTLDWPSVAEAPVGFLFCDGSAVSQSTYPALYALLGTAYNTGGESGGTFRLPNVKGRVVVGPELSASLMTAFNLTQRSIGGYGGEKDHGHTVPGVAHVHGPGGYYSPDHAHGYGGSTGTESAGSLSFGFAGGPNFVTLARGPHAHGFGGATAGVGNIGIGGNSGSTAPGDATADTKSNYQPFLIMNKIIAI